MKIKCKGKFVKKHIDNGVFKMICERCGAENTHSIFVKPHMVQMSDRAYAVDKHGTFRRLK